MRNSKRVPYSRDGILGSFVRWFDGQGGKRLCVGLVLGLGLLSQAASAALPPPSQVFYVPFPEADALAALTAVETGGSGDAPISPITTAISIAAVSDGTVIYYDQWEDGYEHGHDYVAPQQATTRIWGDGNTANGFPPGVPGDLINAGTVIVLSNAVTTTSPQTIDYDARDKIAASRTISVTRTYWATDSGTLFAGCVETFDTGLWGNEYRAPVGQSIADATDGQMFEYTALSILAARDNTTVQIDADNNGAFETTVVLNEGQTHFVNGGVNVGGRVLADKPVQVILFSGDVGSNYESRDSSLLPVSRWSSNYYTPVSTRNDDATRVWLYNAGASQITVSYSYRIGAGTLSSGSLNVAAGAVGNVELTEGAAYRFYNSAGSPFYAYSTTDSDNTTINNRQNADNQAWDWSFTLIPQSLLSPQVLVGLGIGRDPTSATLPGENGNPIWVTTVGNGSTSIVVYVDYDGDNAGPYQDAYSNRYDFSTNVIELQQAKLYDPDGDQTAMLVYVLSTNVSLAVAWGQDPLTATAGAPGLDVGTSIPPVDVIDTAKNLTVIGDSNGDGQLSPSDRARYTIRVSNAARAPIPADIIVKDTLPVDTTYVAGSTYYRTSTNGTWIAVADDGSGTAFPLDVNGLRIQSILPVQGTFEVRFDVDVDSYANLTSGATSLINTGTVHSVVYNRTLPFYNENELHGSIGDRVWNDADNDGVQDAGETGINGVIVYLDVNTNGVRDAGEPYDTTAGDGNYLLTGTFIEAGTHRVRVDTATLPPGTVQTYDLDGVGTAHAATVVLAGGQDRTDVDFGYRVPARLGDFVWVDSNGNGQQDVGEPGLADVVVRLYNSGGTLVATTNTTASGYYAFTNLAAGSFSVSFSPPSGYLFTASNMGDDNADSDPLTGTNRTASITLANGQTDLTVDAGFYLPASLSGAVFVDVDGDGVPDPEDTNGISGATVLLLDASSNTIATASTSATGGYLFSNLPPGAYTVVQVLPGGYTNTLDVAGPNDLRVPVTLASGQNSTGNDFYDARTGAVAAQGKVLYLSDPSQSLDRIDPAATGDNTTTNTATLTAGAGGTATITVSGVAASSSSTQTATSHSFSYNSGTNALNRILMVGISYRNNGSELVTNVTYGGQALSVVGTAERASGTPDGRIYIYQLLSPPTGGNTLQVNWNSALDNGAVIGAITYAGVSQTSPTNAFASANNTSTAPAVTVPSAPGQLAFGVVSGRSTSAYMVSGGGALLWSTIAVSGQTVGAAQSKAGASPNISLTWTGTFADWVAGGVSLIPAPAGTSTATFTQAPAFELPFNMASGATVLITNYVNVTSGSMPANPAITARLSAGGSTFLTLSNPAYNSGNGTLVWSGALPDDVAISAGQVISLSVSNAQSGVEFQIRYDSASYPSKIILPTASIIAVPSLGIYDAAYPAGSLVATSPITAQRYVRVTVTDPFGAYDIAGAGLAIDGPGTSGDVSASLTDAHVVSSNAWSKTYEYVWQTIALSGSYSLTVTANEGSEGITASATTTEILYAAAFGDRVWNDLDGDGTQDAFEPGIADVRVYVDSNGSGTYTVGEPMATTAADGSYFITNLVAGSYTARVDTATLPAGLTQTYDLNGALDHAAVVTLTASQTRTDVDFGYRSTAIFAIRGQVRDDYDLDGMFSDPDLPVGGVLVTLYSDPNGDGTNTDGVVLGTVRTTPDGRYAFTNVMSGAYVVVESDPVYSASTADTVAANDNIIPVVIVASDSVGNDFLDAVDPSGYIYDVADGRIVPGGSITVTGPGAYVLMDGSSGQYMFISTNDASATFTIAVTPPPGYIIDPTRPAQPGSFDPTGGANPTVLGSYESVAAPGYLVNYSAASNTYYYTFTLEPGDPPVINNNFPLVKVVTIGDRVWTDTNGNGVQDVGEPGVTNATVRLLDATSNVVATTVTSVTGAYLFTNLPPATYQIEFVPPNQYLFTVRDSTATNDLADSDADRVTGRTVPVSVAAGTTNLTLDAGLYIPALLKGHVFKDMDSDLLRDTGDRNLTNALVRLVYNGLEIAVTNTDVNGYYQFDNVPAGTVSVLVSRVDATLIAVPGTSDQRRNRALPDTEGVDAVIVFNVISGYGVLAELPSETLNFGFSSYPLSTALDISVYATAGGVMMDIWTVNESGYNDIVVFAWLNNDWAEVGRVPSWQVIGEGSNRYTIQATGLQVGTAYLFKIVDEAGHVHYSNGPIEVTALRVEAVRLDLQNMSVTFNTEAGRSYVVKVSTDLVNWTTEYASYPMARGWSDYVDTPFTAVSTKTQVRVPVNGRQQAFFKIEMIVE